MSNKTLIIAEAGVNHNGNIDLAKKLIDIAANAKADFIKFQTFKADKLATKKAKKSEYQIRNSQEKESQQRMLSRLELSLDDHKILKIYCEKQKIGFMSTAFDIDSLNLLLDLGQSIFKISSGDITNLPYLRFIGSKNKSIILSTGMTTLDEIEVAFNKLIESGTKKEDITILHCNTEYPTPIEDVNLKAIYTIRDQLGVNVGYSDHTLGIEVPIAAVAMGATVIEKHFTLDRTLPGPDHIASLEPNELKLMVQGIRNIEKAMGCGNKKPSPSEIKNIFNVRKSVVAKRTIKKGEKFSEDNLTVKRPGDGISPMEWDILIESVSNHDYEIDDLIR